MESDIARIAWQIEALASQLDSPASRSAVEPNWATAVEVHNPAPVSQPGAANWFANVMQASAMGTSGANQGREFVYVADAMQRALVGLARRLAELEERVSVSQGADGVTEHEGRPESQASADGAPDEPSEAEAMTVRLAEQLDLLDAKLESLAEERASTTEVGEFLEALGGRLERLERVSDEQSPLLEALVESGAHVQLLDARVDATLQRAEEIGKVVQRLDAEWQSAVQATADLDAETQEDADGEATPAHLAVLEDLPFDERGPEAEPERKSFFRRS